MAEKGHKKPKPTGMTSLGSPGLSWDDKSGKPRLVIPVRFGFFGPKRANKTAETDWDDKPGKPRLVIPVRFGVFWPKRAKKPETDWDDKPGKPRLVIPVGFGVFWPEMTKTRRNGLG